MMGELISLVDAYKQTTHKIAGHGNRNIQVLKKALEDFDGEQESDIYGNGKIITEFQKKMAKLLGKESAVFFPSGTMAQQIALRIWCDDKEIKRVAYHPLSHLEIHEEDGLKELHQIETVLLADKDHVIQLKDVINIKQKIACLLLELPQREIGGQLPDYNTLKEISNYCRENEIKLHLDGARLLEVLPYYQKTAAELCSLFDSVYVSVYKGIGGIAGAILAGDQDFTDKSKVWKRRHGGDLISLYPYIVSADYYLDQRILKMGQYFDEAKELAALFNSCHSVSTRPLQPVSNMFHVHFHRPKEIMESVLMEMYDATGIGLTSYLREVDEKECYFEVSLGDLYENIPKNQLNKTFLLLNEKLKS